MRRLLSLDYIIARPTFGWLPTEGDKVQRFEALGLDRRTFPYRLSGPSGTPQTPRSFAFKLPIAVDDQAATFVYVDPVWCNKSTVISLANRRGRVGCWTLERQCGLVPIHATTPSRAGSYLLTWMRPAAHRRAVSGPCRPPGPRLRTAGAGGRVALTRWCVARGEGAVWCAGRRCRLGGAACHATSPVRAAPDRRPAGRRPRAVLVR